MYNNQSYFVNYRAVYCPTIVQGTRKVLSAIGIENIPFIVETKIGERKNILLIGVFHVLSLFTNLIFGSKLLKRGYYLYCNNQTVNLYMTNTEIASALIRNGLFALRLYKKPKKLFNISLTLFVKTVASYVTTLI